MKRMLGRSGIEVSAMGMGCWPIGNTWTESDGQTPLGWGALNDDESIRALRTALEHGITLFDTADIYGCGHSEDLLGRAFEGRRQDVVIATKFGYAFDEAKRLPGGDVGSSPEYIRIAVEGSLRRLRTDVIDLYQFHDGSFPPEEADGVVETLEQLVAEGKIRSYGWSTDDLRGVQAFATGGNCSAAQVQFNVFGGNTDILAFAEERGLALLCRSPLAMGLLSGKYAADSRLTGDDIRTADIEWLRWFKNGSPSGEFIQRRDAIREILRSDGRTIVQGALAWLWAKSEVLVPIPGCKNSRQVVENARAMELGPLSAAQVREAEELVGFEALFV